MGGKTAYNIIKNNSLEIHVLFLTLNSMDFKTPLTISIVQNFVFNLIRPYFHNVSRPSEVRSRFDSDTCSHRVC